MRREWIEMVYAVAAAAILTSPSMRREWIEIVRHLPPSLQSQSPSMRREWIEMQYGLQEWKLDTVSLHAEGVD